MLHGSYSGHPSILSLTLREHIKGFGPPLIHCFSIIPGELDMRFDHTRTNRDRRTQQVKEATEERSGPSIDSFFTLWPWRARSFFKSISVLSLPRLTDYSIQPKGIPRSLSWPNRSTALGRAEAWVRYPLFTNSATVTRCLSAGRKLSKLPVWRGGHSLQCY